MWTDYTHSAPYSCSRTTHSLFCIVVAIFLGMLFTDQANIPGWLTYIMMAFCLVHVLAEFILEIHYCCMYDRNRGSSSPVSLQWRREEIEEGGELTQEEEKGRRKE